MTAPDELGPMLVGAYEVGPAMMEGGCGRGGSRASIAADQAANGLEVECPLSLKSQQRSMD